MKTISLIVIAFFLLVVGTWYVFDHDDIRSLDENASKPAFTVSDSLSKTDQLGVASIQGRPFEIDPDRLLNDRSYENDPGIQEVARILDLSPACVIASAKYKLYKTQVPEGVCPTQEYKATSSVTEVIPGPNDSHPYDNFSIEKLKTMSEYDPAAAIVLARKVEGNQESLRYYEKALILTGNPMPLIEWLNYRTPGEKLAPGELVDVEQAKLGFKIYLVVGAFDAGQGGEGVAESYQERLTSVGVNLEPTKKEAAEIIARIKKERNILFPDSNSNNSQES